MSLLKNFKNSVPLKITFIFLTCLLLLKQLLILSNIFIEYLYIIDFLSWRLFFILCILMLLQNLLNLSFIKDLQQEMTIFNEGPANKSFFMTQLRKYHFSLLLSAYLLYSLAVAYFVNDPLISYLLGLIAFINLILYLVQFVVYTKEYVIKSFKSNNKSISNTDKRKSSTRSMATASNLKKVATNKQNSIENLAKFSIIYLFAIVGSHLYPLITFLISLLILIVLIFFFNKKKNNKLRNHLIVFLFVYWPCCFYFHLHWFVQAVINENILLSDYESPISIKMNLESFGFWVLRFSSISTLNLPTIHLEINPDLFRPFIFETYYCAAVFCEFLGLNFSFYIIF